MTTALLRRAVTQHVRNVSTWRPHPPVRQAMRCSAWKSVGLQRQVTQGTTRRLSKISTAVRASYSAREQGERETLDFRLYIADKSGNTVSPWHDIPLFSEGGDLLNFICEIPKESSAKMEVATDEESTPIKQDIKNGKLRYYPYNINWNYGLLPQTWEDPDVANGELNGFAGDNDPVDLVEIGSATMKMGGVYTVKPLGIYAMIDDGELDWKVVAIHTEDPKADLVNDVEDVEREFPGELEKIMIWFRDYKTPDGKPPNEYGYGAKCQNKEFCLGVVKETNEFWKALKAAPGFKLGFICWN